MASMQVCVCVCVCVPVYTRARVRARVGVRLNVTYVQKGGYRIQAGVYINSDAAFFPDAKGIAQPEAAAKNRGGINRKPLNPVSCSVT